MLTSHFEEHSFTINPFLIDYDHNYDDYWKNNSLKKIFQQQFKYRSFFEGSTTIDRRKPTMKQLTAKQTHLPSNWSPNRISSCF